MGGAQQSILVEKGVQMTTGHVRSAKPSGGSQARQAGWAVLHLGAALTACAGPAQAPPTTSPPTTWTTQFGSSEDDEARSIVTDNEGNTYVAGETSGYLPEQTKRHPQDYDLFVRKLSVSGNALWTRQLNANLLPGTTSSSFRVNDVKVDANRNLYVCGSVKGVLPGQTSADTGENSTDVFILKFTADGTLAAARQFGTDSIDACEAMQIDADGNQYVVGNAGGPLVPEFERVQGYIPFIRKYAPDGRVLWTQQFTAIYTSTSNSTSVSGSQVRGAGLDTNGNLYVAGPTLAPFPEQSLIGYADGYLRKYTPDGTAVWTRQFNPAGPTMLIPVNDLAVDADGNSYVTGSTDAGDNIYLIKYRADGAQEWLRTFGDTYLDEVSSVALARDGQVFVAWTTAPVTESENVFLQRFTPDGTAGAARKIDTGGNDRVNDLTVDQSGSISLAGATNGTFPTQRPSGQDDAFVMKLAP